MAISIKQVITAKAPVGYTGSSGAYAAVGFTGSHGEIGYIGSTGVIGYTGSVGPEELTSTFPGTAFTPYVGTVRRYFNSNRTFVYLSACVSSQATSNILVKLLKNSVESANITLTSGNFYVARKSISVSVSSGDYLTINIDSGNPTDLIVFIS